MNQTPILDEAEQKRKRGLYFRRLALEAITNNQTIGAAKGMPVFYSMPHDENRAYLRKIANDLSEQTDLVTYFFDIWVNDGDPIPPSFPNRICIILRKWKDTESEFDFLSAYLRHFTDTVSPVNAKMVQRGIAIGAFKME